jgi:hypothetical protein
VPASTWRRIGLTALAGVVFVLLLVMTGGALVVELIGLTALAVWCCLHYVLWGRSLSRETPGERGEVSGE